MEQLLIFDQPLTSAKLFCRYPGAKLIAAKHLAKFIPKDVNQIVSPFIGGGSFELFLTCRNIRVYGYDKFEPLVHCWNYALKDAVKLSDWCYSILPKITKENLSEIWKNQFKDLSEFETAGYFWLLCALSWNGAPIRGLYDFIIKENQAWQSTKNGYVKPKIDWKRLREFSNNLISVKCLDFEEALERHPDMFTYCDPPYPGVGNMYGNNKEYHSEFDHERLMKCLSKRKTDWLLSYNNQPLIQELYPQSEYNWKFQPWRKTKTHYGNPIGTEVLISPKIR